MAAQGPPTRDAELHLTPLVHLEGSKPPLYIRGKKLIKIIPSDCFPNALPARARYLLTRADDSWSAEGHLTANSKRNNTWRFCANPKLRKAQWTLTDVVTMGNVPGLQHGFGDVFRTVIPSFSMSGESRIACLSRLRAMTLRSHRN